jgi:acyl carrier protein
VSLSARGALSGVAAIIRETFEQPDAIVDRNTTALDIPGWDSLSHTVLMLRVEEHFGVTLPEDVEFRNVGDLADTLVSLRGEASGQALSVKSRLPKEEDTVLRSFSAPKDIDLQGVDRGRLDVSCKGVTFPIYFRRASHPRLFVLLGGAVDRQTLSLPVFARRAWWPLMPGSILCISDPTLDLSEEMQIGWYVGTKEKNYTKMMARIISRVAEQLGLAPSDIVFYASSGGGFASLMCARYIPGANCIVVNPQTNLRKYYDKHKNRLAAVFEPGADKSFDTIAKESGKRISIMRAFPDADSLPPMVYAQNKLDKAHFRRHYTAFCKKYHAPIEGGVSGNGRIKTVVFESDKGHGPEPRELVKPLIEQGLAFFAKFK